MWTGTSPPGAPAVAASDRGQQTRTTVRYVDDDSDDDHDNDDFGWLEREYVVGSMIIGIGLFLAVPSLLSEGFLEAAAPVATASDVVSDVTSNNVLNYLRSWTPSSIGLWKEVSTKVGGGGGGGGDRNFSTTTGAAPTPTTRLMPNLDHLGKSGKT
jgi:hypothetical protein